MNLGKRIILINNVKLPINASLQEAFSTVEKIIKKAGLSSYAEDYSVYRRSVDARHKPDIYFVYTIAVSGHFPDISEDIKQRYGLILTSAIESPECIIGDIPINSSPVIVGAGPCGLFAALLLAENGYNPIIIERGGSIKERAESVVRFYKTHILDTNTNIQFGAGGAGTFSDGKLVTRTNDPLTNYILEKFIEFGAPENIRYIAKPHIGTDVLSQVVDKMLTRITDLGGRVLYHTKFMSFEDVGGKVTKVITDKGEVPCGALILAIGHSARDTYYELFEKNFTIEPKSFSVGMRIEHLAEDIDYAMYGAAAGNPVLGHAEYTLSHDTKTRGTYTFCMCPGGVVVAAASEEEGVVVNGMSYNNRAERNSNSAIVTSVFKEDYGATPAKAIEFQKRIERLAYKAGGGGYCAPVITFGDFISDKCSTSPMRIMPSYMSGDNVKLARPEEYLPNFVCDGIKSAVISFDKRINGFASPDAVLTGAETRTSAPVRILRNNETRLAIGYKNIYPAGEGAGYAGGITSAAIDGAKTALALMRVYSPNDKI